MLLGKPILGRRINQYCSDDEHGCHRDIEPLVITREILFQRLALKTTDDCHGFTNATILGSIAGIPVGNPLGKALLAGSTVPPTTPKSDE